MRIQTESAASLKSLAEYLERCECIVRFFDDRTIDVGVAPRSLAQRYGDDEIELEGVGCVNSVTGDFAGKSCFAADEPT